VPGLRYDDQPATVPILTALTLSDSSSAAVHNDGFA